MHLRDYGLLTRLLRTRPLLLASIMLLIGCIMGYFSECSPFPSAICLAVLLLSTLLLFRRNARIAAAVLVIAMLPLGMLRFQLAWQATAPFPDQRGALLSGRICEIPEWRQDTERSICVLDEIEIGGIPEKGKLRLYLRGDVNLLTQVQLGQRVSCTAHIWEADTATNPGQFNFSNYLRVRGLSGYATAEVESAAFTDAELYPMDAVQLLRERIAARAEKLFPKNPSIAKAFLIGDRSDLSAEERQSYAASGAAHLLAISGMHISVLAGAVTLLLGRFMNKRSAFLLTLVLLLLYGALIGFGASLTRAILMFAIFGAAPLAGRYSDPPTRLAAAMFIYLMIRPAAILDAGFVLSFAASAGIIFLNPPLARLFHAEELIRRKPGVGLRGMLYGIPKWIVQTLLATCSAQIAILPAVVHYFGAQPLVSFGVNLIAIPLAMAAYIASIIGILISFAPLAAVGDFLFGLLTGCVRFFGSLPLAALRIARFPAWLALMCAIECLLASELSKLPEKLRRFLPLTVILAVFVSNLCAMLSTLGCSIVFLDAGQADCAVLRTQGKVYLLDTGDSYSPAADYLSAMNYPLDGVFLSHPHIDHAGGLEDILALKTPETIFISANWHALEADDGVQELLIQAEEQGSEIVFLSAGEEIQLSRETKLQVLSPQAGILPSAANDDSLVLRVEHCGTSALFTGDASAEAIASMVEDTDILKVPHHGALDAVNAELILRSTPSVAIIPTGYNNYGHPRSETIELLQRGGARVFRTDECGAITCHLKEDGLVRVRTYLSSEAENGLE